MLRRAGRNAVVAVALVSAAAASGAGIGILEQDTRFFSGETVRRTVTAQDADADMVAWRTSVLDAPVQSGRARFDDTRASVKLTMPEVKRRAKIDWVLSAGKGKEPAESTVVTYSVFPRAKDDVCGTASTAVFDPKGACKDILRGKNVEVLENRMQLATFGGGFLIIAPGALRAVRWDAFEVLEERIEKGINILCLAQESLPEDMPVSVGKQGTCTEAVPVVKDTLFEQIQDGDLASWRGNGKVAGAPLEPAKGTKGMVLVKGAGEYGVLVVEVYRGKSVLTFSQLALCEKFSSEPAAYFMLRNLIRRARTARPQDSDVDVAPRGTMEKEEGGGE